MKFAYSPMFLNKGRGLSFHWLSPTKWTETGALRASFPKKHKDYPYPPGPECVFKGFHPLACNPFSGDPRETDSSPWPSTLNEPLLSLVLCQLLL